MTELTKDIIATVLWIILLAAAIFLLASCKKREVRVHEAAAKTKYITYVRDSRTDLCFAFLGEMLDSESAYAGLATVPCDKVERYLDYAAEDGSSCDR